MPSEQILNSDVLQQSDLAALLRSENKAVSEKALVICSSLLRNPRVSLTKIFGDDLDARDRYHLWWQRRMQSSSKEYNENHVKGLLHLKSEVSQKLAKIEDEVATKAAIVEAVSKATCFIQTEAAAEQEHLLNKSVEEAEA